MRRRLLVVLTFASLVGILASLLIYQVVSRAASAGVVPNAEPVVVATVNIGIAESITERHVKVVPWPKDSIPVGAVRTLAEAQGRVVRASIVAGEPLLDGKLAPALTGRGGIMPMLVPEGRRGISIRVDDAIRESGFVMPNSHVDVLVSMAKDGSASEKVAKVILQDVPVLAAGQVVEMRDNKPVQVTTVTLALTPDESERLALAQNYGRLTLATRNLRDNGLVETKGVTPASLLGAGARPAPVAAAATTTKKVVARPAAAAPAQYEYYSVSVIRGPKLTEQRFVRDGAKDWREQSGKEAK